MYDLRLEYQTIKPAIDEAVRRVIEGGRFVMGEEVFAFEEQFAQYCGARHAIGVGSGTAAIELAVRACGIGPGDEVITVPNSDISTTAPISHCGALIVWVDIDRRTFAIDPNQIERAIGPRTKAIIPVHLFGHPADMDAVMDIARRHNLIVIEDAALAIGATYKGKHAGTIGHVGCFSFAPTKILGAYGQAGLVATNDPAIAEKLRVLRNYGFDLSHEAGPHAHTLRTWTVLSEGFNERLDTLQAAVLSAKLPTLERRIKQRRTAVARYNRLLAGLDLATPYEAPDVRHVYRAYTVLIQDREPVRRHLFSVGIATQVYYAPPLHLQPAYAHLGFRAGSFPAAEEVGRSMLSLPVFPGISEEQISMVAAEVQACVPRKTTRGAGVDVD